MTDAGDPGHEDAVWMVDEVLAREGVDELALAAQVRGGDRHQLPVARGRRDFPGPRKQAAAAIVSDERRHDEDQRVVVAGHESVWELVHAGDVRAGR